MRSAWLGIGAAWFQREHEGLGFAFPPLAQRFEMLEEAIQICEQMWSDDNGPFTGKHYQLKETLCSPRPLQRPRPRILVGGSGEKKTLRLVARYGDACNVRGADPESTKGCSESSASTVSVRAGTTPPSRRRSSPASIPAPAANGQTRRSSGWRRFSEIGVQAALGYLVGCEDPRVMEAMATKVIPQLERL